MKQVLINFRIDEYKKEKAERLCDNLGLNLSSLINLLLTHSIEVGGIPFPVMEKSGNISKGDFEEKWSKHIEMSKKYGKSGLSEEDIMNMIKNNRRKG